MCDHAPRLIGTRQIVGERDSVAADIEKIKTETCNLVRAKTGLDCALVECEHGLAVTLLEGPAFGMPPAWCTRSIDRARPDKLILRISPIVERGDGAFIATVEILET